MLEVVNRDEKRVCDVSEDNRLVEIRRRDCITRITANPDGTLSITQDSDKPTA